MPEHWIELLVNAPDRATAEAFDRRLQELRPALKVAMGSGPDVPADYPPPPRYVVWSLVGGDRDGTRQTLQDALNAALSEMKDVTVENGPASQALDMTVVFL